MSASPRKAEASATVNPSDPGVFRPLQILWSGKSRRTTKRLKKAAAPGLLSRVRLRKRVRLRLALAAGLFTVPGE